MSRNKVAMILPEEMTEAKTAGLAEKLKKNGLTVLGKNRFCVVVKLSDKIVEAVDKTKSAIRELWVDKLPDARIKQMPDDLKRIAIFWNVYCNQGGNGVEPSVMTRALKQAGLEVREDRVFDVTQNKFIGDKIITKKGEKSVGNWTLLQSWYWYPIPVFCIFGIPVGHIAVVNCTSTASVTCSLITAQMYGPHHYASVFMYNSTKISTTQSGFIPFWEVTNNVTLISSAQYDGVVKTATTTLTV